MMDNASDPALSLNMLLQMLQSLVLPLQGAAVQEIEARNGRSTTTRNAFGGDE